MNIRRKERLANLIHTEVSKIIQEDIKDPRVNFVTLTGVEVSDDFHHAKIYITTSGDEKERTQNLDGLTHAAGFIRTLLSQRLRLKFIPQLSFRFDHSIEYSDHIHKLLNEIYIKRNEP